MINRTRKSVWDPHAALGKSEMNARIKNAIFLRGWQEAVKIIKNKNIPMNQLNIAEVGCGTGTLALTFGLLGASVTLIDFNENALERAKNIYRMYDCQARFITADCLDATPPAIKGFFDVVISDGLLEHFIEEKREQCLRYHKMLLKSGGFVFIGVPNAHSPWYRFVIFFRKITRTWDIDLEVPFSAKELKSLAQKEGFATAYVIPNADAWIDFKYYARGFLSAFTDLFPKRIKDGLKRYRNSFKRHAAQPFNQDEDMKGYCATMAGLIKKDLPRQISRIKFFDKFSSALVLFAFKSMEKTDV